MIEILIQKVNLVNYKSVGDKEDYTLIVEPKCTAIVGKNESGKSNVISGLSELNLKSINSQAFNPEKVNRNSENPELEYEICLAPKKEEISNYNLAQSTITITKDSHTVSGGINNYIKQTISAYLSQALEAFQGNPFGLKQDDYSLYKKFVAQMTNLEEIDIPFINRTLPKFDSWIRNANTENKDIIEKIISTFSKSWDEMQFLIPIFFYRNDRKVLKTQYHFEEIKKELNNPGLYPQSLLSDFLRLIGVDSKTLLEAVSAGVSGSKTSIRHMIQRQIKKKINDEFAQFYTVEPIELTASFDSNTVYFSVQSSEGESLLLSERSNGLRWYLNTFIDVKAHDLKNNNVVYLFDEPGISLHVNAQQELIHLFSHLCDNDNQIIYTTHSPYMLDLKESGVERIRAVVKDNEGFTHIYTKVYDARISPDYQKDTLAPVISALGMNLHDTFGPAKDRINIVTEGMSDYYYLVAMARYLRFDLDKYSFIPSVGATNVLHICNILHGWGCPCVALFDYDDEGVKKGAEYMRKKLYYELGKDYLFVKDVCQEDIDSKSYKTDRYTIEDVVTESELIDFMEKFKIDNNLRGNKTLLAKLFSDHLQDGSYICGEMCSTNFQKLFERIESTQ